MRILAIRGENLASLAGPFEIDLAAGPLAGTGLFAIIGDTGAGKSTLLDCVCLALYGRYPRATGTESVGDLTGDDLRSADPRNILRRQAASGHAEADFLAHDGHAYRARWSVRRARGKGHGTLQKAQHTLVRIDDGSAIAHAARETADAVVARTGLTYDEFRRTVLLAQGEFDAFLLADEATRAGLLEKITGTEIYSKISAQTFRLTGERKAALAVLEAREATLAVLPEDELARLAHEETRTRHDLATTVAEIVRLEHISRQVATAIEARAALTAQAKTLATATTAAAAASPMRLRLADLAKVEPLRGRIAAVAAADRQVDVARAAWTLARASAETAASAETEAVAAADDALLKAVAVEAEIATLTLAWQEAADLDVRIESARAEATRAGREAAVAADELRAVGAAEMAARQRHDGSRAALAAAEATLASRLAHAGLAADLDHIEEALENHLRLRTEHAETDARADALAREAALVQGLIETALARVRTSAIEREALDGEIMATRSRLAALDPTGAEDREAVVRAAVGKLSVVRERTLALIDARRQYDAAGSEHVGAGTERTAARAALARAHERLAADQTRRAETQHLADLAAATLSAQAIAIRAALIDQAPCPVCGATDHPFAGDQQAHAFAETLGRRRQELDRTIAALDADVRRLTAVEAAAEARERAAQSAGATERARAATAEQDLVRLHPDVSAALAALGRAALEPPWTALDPVAGIRAAASALEDELRQLAATRRDRDACARALDTALGRRDALEREASADRSTVEDHRRRHAGLTSSVAGQIAARDLLIRQLADRERALAPSLGAAGLTLAALRSESADIGRHIRQLAEEWRRLDAERGRHAAALPELASALGHAVVRREATERVLSSTRVAAGERSRALAALADARKALLQGEPTATHRAAAMARLDRARETSETARRAASAAERERAARQAALAVEGAARGAAEDASRRARGDLDRAAAGLAIEPAAAVTLLAADPGERDRLTADLAALDDSLAAARTLTAARERDLARAVATLAGNEPEPEALRAAQVAAGERADRLKARLATIQRDLEVDTTQRRIAADLAREITAARTDLEVWSSVNEAIGQADGAKFRRFAQGVTLRHLAHLANVQLATLNPRYHLRVGATSPLALDIVDRDMADEVRGPRSLSGGERFLVSLALALALARLDGSQTMVDTLFIDEGFGALDRDTLDMAMATLETLHGHGRKVGVITHASAMIDRIPVQIRVVKRGNGRSSVEVHGLGF